MVASEFINILNESGVELFSITDHNYFPNVYYDEVDKYITNNNLNIKELSEKVLQNRAKEKSDRQKEKQKLLDEIEELKRKSD